MDNQKDIPSEFDTVLHEESRMNASVVICGVG